MRYFGQIHGSESPFQQRHEGLADRMTSVLAWWKGLKKITVLKVLFSQSA
jgi:hypothetical protein